MGDGAGERMQGNMQRVAEYQKKWHPHQYVANRVGSSMLPFTAAGKFAPIDQEQDSRIQLKTGLVDKATGATPFGMATLQESELDWIQRKRDLARQLDDYRVFTQMYDLNDPAELMIAKQVCPQYWKALEEQMEFDFQLLKKLEELAIHGLQSWEDFQLVSALFRGEIEYPKLTLSSDAPATSAYTLGLFNPRKVLNLSPDRIQSSIPLRKLATFLWRGTRVFDSDTRGTFYSPVSSIAEADAGTTPLKHVPWLNPK